MTEPTPPINPAAASAAASAALEAAQTKFPNAPEVADNLVPLPGGLIEGEHEYTTAVVKELTGADEEAMARAAVGGNSMHFLSTLLECGTEKVGDADPEHTKELLKRLLVGDRDAILIGIRVATYGKELTVPAFVCPECSQVSEVTFSDITTDIETRKLDSPLDAEFELEISKDRTVTMRLPNAGDQAIVAENNKWTLPERNTRLIQLCVQHIKDNDTGRKQSMQGFPSMALALSLRDRRAILDAIAEREPGPRYNDIKITHDCGKEVSLALDLGDLFLA